MDIDYNTHKIIGPKIFKIFTLEIDKEVDTEANEMINILINYYINIIKPIIKNENYKYINQYEIKTLIYKEMKHLIEEEIKK